MPSKSSLRRIITIFDWLKQSKAFTTKSIGSALQISPRTIREDIDYMKSLGIPVEFNPRKNTYELTEAYENLPWQIITGTEVATLLVATLAMNALGNSVHASTLNAVVDRLSEFLPETMIMDSSTLRNVIRFEFGARPLASIEHLKTIQQAASHQRVLSISYHSNSKNEDTQRDIEPYRILYQERHWYVIAYCRLRMNMRDFRLDRITSCTVNEEVFVIPPDFDLNEYLDPAFGMHRGDKEYAIHIRFSPKQARWIREEKWHKTQIMKIHSDGALDLMMQASGLNDIARWVLSYGGEAEVIAPPILREKVATEAQRMAALYNKN